MKVYGGLKFHKGKQLRAIFAGTQKQLSAVTGESVTSIREYWAETGNKRELEIALSEPGTLFVAKSAHPRDDEFMHYSDLTQPPPAPDAAKEQG